MYKMMSGIITVGKEWPINDLLIKKLGVDEYVHQSR